MLKPVSRNLRSEIKTCVCRKCTVSKLLDVGKQIFNKRKKKLQPLSLGINQGRDLNSKVIINQSVSSTISSALLTFDVSRRRPPSALSPAGVRPRSGGPGRRRRQPPAAQRRVHGGQLLPGNGGSADWPSPPAVVHLHLWTEPTRALLHRQSPAGKLNVGTVLREGAGHIHTLGA